MYEDLPDVSVTVSEFVDLLNETYEFAFPSIVISGELANLKVSRGKWLYFDLKDDEASVRLFGTVFNLPGPLEDGMLLNVRGTPHMHERFGFSVNIQLIQPVGEGAIKRAAELLAAKLQTEGLFAPERKRSLPYPPRRIGLITSAQSAAYADFIKILGDRWGGLQIDLIDVQVQGEPAPAQIVAAIERFNGLAAGQAGNNSAGTLGSLAGMPEVLVLIRGGGSADDLAAFSSEQVTRAVAGSRIPTLVAIGHEVDVSLAELAADRRASTPSNAAELLTPDKRVVLETLSAASEQLYDAAQDNIFAAQGALRAGADDMHEMVTDVLRRQREQLAGYHQLLQVLSPEAALQRGYAIVRDHKDQAIAAGSATLPAVGAIVHIELRRARIEATVIKSQEKQ